MLPDAPRRLAGLLACLLAAAACAAPGCREAPPGRVQLLLVNDVYRLDPDAADRGGLARVATLVRGLRREADHTLFVLAGDTISPSLLSTLVRGRQMIEAWNLLGLDVATFGNHEFDWGPATLRERMGESRFTWVSSNVRDRATGRPFGGAEPWRLLRWDGLRVGVIGLTLEDTARTSSPGPEVAFAPALSAAAEAFAAMGVTDLRVAVTHLPVARDRELARAAGLDAVLGGHDHDPILETAGLAVIVKAGADAVNVGQVVYEVGGCRPRVRARRERLIPVDARIPAAPDVTALEARYAQLAERELDVRVGTTPVALDGREAVIRREPTGLGRFLAEAMRHRMGADLALLNSGAIRGNRLIAPGPVTRRGVHALLPFGNVIVLIEVSGAALRRALEHSVDRLPRPAGHYLQTAGVEFTVDPDAPPGRRVGAVRVLGAPLDPARTYRVATLDFLARGKDDYPMLAEGRVLVAAEDGPGLVEAVLEAVAAGRIPAAP